MGADVMHPAPGQTTTPSFAALVASVNTTATKYIAIDGIQATRQEIISDLKTMSKRALQLHMSYRERVEKKSKESSIPKRLIFYRDGVSEGQFQQLLATELPMLKEACTELKIKPKITFIVVGKRHHIRLFPEDRDADRSGNCPAGTVVDKAITHPVEYDFYLQSHSGILGTSRSAHYSVIYDENQLNPDSMQSLSYALCHIFARSTRSVSIPAPVYYADIVCTKAKTRFDPTSSSQASDAGTEHSGTLESYARAFQALHANQATKMYFL